jgi:hypothetical protein
MEQLDCSMGKCTLGVHLAPDDNNKDAISHLRRKAETWQEYITTGHLNRQDACFVMETTIMRSLLYPLPALTLTEKECNHIIAQVLSAGLQNLAVCKNFPCAVTYGPKEEGGFNLPNLFTQQGVLHIAAIVDHISSQDMMGELLQTSIEATKVKVGVDRNLFSLDYTIYHPLLTDTWIKETWKFARDHQIEIVDKATLNLSLHRENDVFLMEIFSHHGFKSKELKKNQSLQIIPSGYNAV